MVDIVIFFNLLSYINLNIKNGGVFILKILITGAESSLGIYITNYFKTSNEIFEFTNNSICSFDKNKCYELITKVNPDLLIHCETMDNIEDCEKDESTAYKINTIGTLNIAYPCSILNIPIIFLSTSYVYGGNKSSSYFETDECKPINVYGKTKLAGEKLIRTLCKKYFIIRCGWIFGTLDCFVKNILINSDVPLFLCSTELGNTTYVVDLCILINEMLHSDLYGIYNCGNEDAVNKSTIVKSIINISGTKKNILELPENLIVSSAPRPKNSSLNMSLIKNCFNVHFATWENRLIEYINECKKSIS